MIQELVYWGERLYQQPTNWDMVQRFFEEAPGRMVDALCIARQIQRRTVDWDVLVTNALEVEQDLEELYGRDQIVAKYDKEKAKKATIHAEKHEDRKETHKRRSRVQPRDTKERKDRGRSRSRPRFEKREYRREERREPERTDRNMVNAVPKTTENANNRIPTSSMNKICYKC